MLLWLLWLLSYFEEDDWAIGAAGASTVAAVGVLASFLRMVRYREGGAATGWRVSVSIMVMVAVL